MPRNDQSENHKKRKRNRHFSNQNKKNGPKKFKLTQLLSNSVQNTQQSSSKVIIPSQPTHEYGVNPDIYFEFISEDTKKSQAIPMHKSILVEKFQYFQKLCDPTSVWYDEKTKQTKKLIEIPLDSNHYIEDYFRLCYKPDKIREKDKDSGVDENEQVKDETEKNQKLSKPNKKEPKNYQKKVQRREEIQKTKLKRVYFLHYDSFFQRKNPIVTVNDIKITQNNFFTIYRFILEMRPACFKFFKLNAHSIKYDAKVKAFVDEIEGDEKNKSKNHSLDESLIAGPSGDNNQDNPNISLISNNESKTNQIKGENYTDAHLDILNFYHLDIRLFLELNFAVQPNVPLHVWKDEDNLKKKEYEQKIQKLEKERKARGLPIGKKWTHDDKYEPKPKMLDSHQYANEKRPDDNFVYWHHLLRLQRAYISRVLRSKASSTGAHLDCKPSHQESASHDLMQILRESDYSHVPTSERFNFWQEICDLIPAPYFKDLHMKLFNPKTVRIHAGALVDSNINQRKMAEKKKNEQRKKKKLEEEKKKKKKADGETKKEEKDKKKKRKRRQRDQNVLRLDMDALQRIRENDREAGRRNLFEGMNADLVNMLFR